MATQTPETNEIWDKERVPPDSSVVEARAQIPQIHAQPWLISSNIHKLLDACQGYEQIALAPRGKGWE
eukprot:5221412-Pyramimonas_sp.AAC.2